MSEVFVNSVGRAFQVSGISPLEVERVRISIEARWKKSGRFIDPPSYAAENAAGVKQLLLHDESTVETEEEKAALAAYQQNQQAYESEVNTAIMSACFLCVDTDPLQDSLWLSRMRMLSIDVPEDALECLKLYVETQVIRGTADIPKLLTSVLLAGGAVNKEAALAAEATFQRQLETAQAA